MTQELEQKTYTLPLPYQDAILVAISEGKLTAALDTLEDFKTAKYHPSTYSFPD